VHHPQARPRGARGLASNSIQKRLMATHLKNFATPSRSVYIRYKFQSLVYYSCKVLLGVTLGYLTFPSLVSHYVHYPFALIL